MRENYLERQHLTSVRTSATTDRMSNIQIGAVLAIGVVFCVGISQQWSPLNGSRSLTGWEWPWHDLGILKTALLLLLPFTVIAWVLQKVETDGAASNRSSLLGLLVLSNFLLQTLGMLADPRGVQLIRRVVISPGATSYFLDATHIETLRDWLSNFDQANLGYHSLTHPPGPILFYYTFLKLFSPTVAAFTGGCVVGMLASTGIIVMYIFAGLWTRSECARFTAAAYYALVPALTVFFPEFDQTYPIVSMLLILFWIKALNLRQWRFGVYLGIVLFMATFFSYTLLTIGVFLAYYGLYWFWREKQSATAWITLVRTSGIMLSVCTSLHFVLRLTTRYHALASFRHALASQSHFADALARSYIANAVFNPYDFLLGAGILALPVMLFWFQRLWQQSDPIRTESALTLIALATILTLDLSGIWRGETAREWLFLQPLLVVPVALGLSRVPWGWRISIFTVQWWILVCLKAKMVFIFIR